MIPWAFCALVVGVALIVVASYRCDIGRPRWLLRWGASLTVVGLGAAAAFLSGTGILAVVGTDLLSTGDTFVSTFGTLAASVFTLLILPIGLLAFGVAVLGDKALPTRMRTLPLVGTLVFIVGPVLVAVLPEPDERTVFITWPVLLAAVWAAYGLLVTTAFGRESETPQR